MSTENKVIVVNKLIGQPQPPEIHLSKTQQKAIKWMTKRLVEDELLTSLQDLTQFVRSKKSHEDNKNNSALRKFASRLVEAGVAEALGNGMYIPAGYREYVIDTDIKVLAKIKNKRQKNSVIKAQNRFLNLIKPIVASKQNQWCMAVTHLSVKFKVDGLYEKLGKLNILEKYGKYYILPFKDEQLPYLKAVFHIYPNKVVLKLGNLDCPIYATESIITSALFICHKYLIYTNNFWRFNLEIPPAHEWLITIPYLYCITTNTDYTPFNGTTKDDNLGFELTEIKGKHLRLKQNLPQIELKPAQLVGFFNIYHPLKILDLEPSSFCKNQSQIVTLSKNIVTNSIFNDKKKTNYGEIVK